MQKKAFYNSKIQISPELIEVAFKYLFNDYTDPTVQTESLLGAPSGVVEELDNSDIIKAVTKI